MSRRKAEHTLSMWAMYGLMRQRMIGAEPHASRHAGASAPGESTRWQNHLVN